MLFSAVSSHAAVMTDLTVATSATINGGLFQTTNFGSTGTGVFDPFLDLEKTGSGSWESAYNSSAWPILGDNHRDTWNSDLRFADLKKVSVSNVEYYLFTLDANEPGGGTDKKLLSIDQIKVYQSSTAALNPGTGNLSALGTLIWDMDAGINGDSWVKIDSSLGSAGSGDADLNVFIPASLFDSTKSFVYFYNQNGAQGGDLSAEAGFEEWSALRVPNGTPNTGGGGGVPDGGTSLILLGGSLLALGSARKLMLKKA